MIYLLLTYMWITICVEHFITVCPSELLNYMY